MESSSSSSPIISHRHSSQLSATCFLSLKLQSEILPYRFTPHSSDHERVLTHSPTPPLPPTSNLFVRNIPRRASIVTPKKKKQDFSPLFSTFPPTSHSPSIFLCAFNPCKPHLTEYNPFKRLTRRAQLIPLFPSFC